MSDCTHRGRVGVHSSYKWMRRKKPRPRSLVGKSPLHRPCPDCKGETRSMSSQKKPGEFWRVCKKNHRWAWTQRGLPIRRIETQKPHEPGCIFPGCDKISSYDIRKLQGKYGGDRLCEGHSKQKQRHGWNGLRPLKPYVKKHPRWRKA